MNLDEFLNIYQELKNRSVNYKNLVKNLIDNISKKAVQIRKNGKTKRLSFDDCKNLIFELSDSILKTSINIDSFTILEMIFFKYFDENTNNEEKNDIKLIQSKVENEIETESNVEKIIDNDLKRIRINNCFVDAQKNCLQDAKNELTKLLESENLDGKTRTLLTDSKIVAASNTNLILTCSNPHNVENANKLLDDIQVLFQKNVEKKYKIIFLTDSEWQEERKKYIENIKNNKKYSYINELTENKEKNVEKMPEINNVFDISKVEIV